MPAIWKGSITFGLVNIPVELKTAVRADHISDYRANLMKVIKAKMKGKKPKLKAPEKTHDTGVLDLMSRLRASLEEGGAKKDAVRARSKAVAATRKTAARTKKRKTA